MIQRTTDVHEHTVRDAATHASVYNPPAATQRLSGTWNSPLARSQVDPSLLASALDAAGGDSTRLWFDADGSVWVLNHTRATRCPGGGCPACRSRGRQE